MVPKMEGKKGPKGVKNFIKKKLHNLVMSGGLFYWAWRDINTSEILDFIHEKSGGRRIWIILFLKEIWGNLGVGSAVYVL